ncbi:hypothetical protein GY45DRAFT_293587 [Cubamyces sp. BRFM 1775]|nr:hypothetical protein GY45DRAFT_293587 [Cubamyces sp. BRFM 1775]
MCTPNRTYPWDWSTRMISRQAICGGVLTTITASRSQIALYIIITRCQSFRPTFSVSTLHHFLTSSQGVGMRRRGTTLTIYHCLIQMPPDLPENRRDEMAIQADQGRGLVVYGIVQESVMCVTGMQTRRGFGTRAQTTVLLASATFCRLSV